MEIMAEDFVRLQLGMRLQLGVLQHYMFICFLKLFPLKKTKANQSEGQ